MPTAPTLPKFNGGSFTDQQANGLVTGISFATALALENSNIQIMAALGSASLAASTSATYVDVAGTAASWTKTGDAAGSDVFVLMTVRAFSSVNTTRLGFGINIGGTDYDVILGDTNTTNHETYAGFQRIAGVASGSYTPNIRFKRISGTGAITINAGDTLSFLIGEIPK